ncbi:tRNA (5-methylaminomethyl-2-thiouridine)(34)-methyltransferase MnmD [Nautilia lithotrophica]
MNGLMNFVETKDGTFTLKSEKYNECYHSSEGAYTESLYKHVHPGYTAAEKFGYYGGEIRILDICFGLGYNTLTAILHKPKNVKLKIFSPELDLELVRSLKNFNYPDKYKNLLNVINDISKNLYYKSNDVEIEIHPGDAREYIKKLSNIHIIYQDAFSPKVNQELWTFEYFTDISNILNENGIITTYSVATPVRCAFYKLGMKIYTHPYDNIRKGTIASYADLPFPKVDFEEKLKRVECKTY